MSDDYAFFEYRAKITNAGHAEDVGERVHCFVKMKHLERYRGGDAQTRKASDYRRVGDCEIYFYNA